MPVNGSKKPAGGYRAGGKGSYGCNGYPTVSADGTVHGCHPTKAKAQAQARAIWASVAKKSITSVSKAMVSEGDFVMFICHDEEIKVGRVEYVMNEGIYGLSGSEYSIEATPEDPALSIRIFEEEDGAWEETEYTVGHKASEVVKIESIKVAKDVIVEMTSSMNGMSEQTAEIDKRNYSRDARRRMADSGDAMPDGSYPIANETDLRNAIRSIGRATNYDAVKEHIIRRAKEMGLTRVLPEDWKNKAEKGMTGWGGSIFDITPFVK